MGSDIYIRVIEYSIEKNTKFNLGELFDALKLDESQQGIILDEIRFKKILSSNSSGHVFDNNPRDVVIWCSTEDRFKLLEYYELKEARKSAKEARTVATFAIIISALSLIASIVVSVVQLNTPIRLSDQVEQSIIGQGTMTNSINIKVSDIEKAIQTLQSVQQETLSSVQSSMESNMELQAETSGKVDSLLHSSEKAIDKLNKIIENNAHNRVTGGL